MPKQILLVEDSVTIQKVVQIAFAREDYQIRSATSADEALGRLREGRPDVVVADAGLTGKSGYDLAAAVKADAATKDVPVLLLTGNFNPYDEARGQRSGVDAFLVKPFDTQSIIDKVNGLLRGRAGAAPAAGAAAQPAPAARPTPAPVAAATPAPASKPTVTPAPIAASEPAPVAAAPAVAPMAAAEVPRSTLMGMPTVQPLGTPNLRPPAPTPVSVKVKEPASAPIAAPVASAPTPVAVAPVVSAAPAAARPEPQPEGSRMPEPVRPSAVGAASPSGAAGAGIPSQVPQMPRPSLIPRAPIPAPVLSALERIAARGAEYEAVAKLSVETIQQIAWEVVPELAELILRAEKDRKA
jgi:CheY-like chemotaxis protein